MVFMSPIGNLILNDLLNDLLNVLLKASLNLWLIEYA